MAERLEENWQKKYALLRAFVAEYHQFPSKTKVENRGLLNWWKYNQRLIRQNKLSDDKIQLLKQLDEVRRAKK